MKRKENKNLRAPGVTVQGTKRQFKAGKARGGNPFGIERRSARVPLQRKAQ